MKAEHNARMAEEQVHSLLRRYRSTGETRLRDGLVLQYKPLVESIARRFAGSGEPLEDLIQEGYIGLITATDLYDTEKGVKFSTYATHFIIGQIKHALRDRGKIIKEPAWLQELNHKISKVEESLCHDLGRQPTNAEIGRVMHLPEETVAEILTTREVFKVSSLDCELDESGGAAVDLEKVKSEKYETFQLPIEDKIVLETAMNKLKIIEQKVIQEFYFNGLNQTEIAKKLGISCNYVSHILRSGTRKLRRILTTEEIREMQMQLQLAGRRMGRPTVEAESVVDALTGLYGGSYMAERLEEEISRASRDRYDLAFAIVAIEGLDRFAAMHGAMYRDDILCSLASLIRSSVRRCDVVGRVGQHEFGLLLSHVNSQPDRVCERVRHAIAKATFTTTGLKSPASFECTIGFALFPSDGENASDLISFAWQALHTVRADRKKKAA